MGIRVKGGSVSRKGHGKGDKVLDGKERVVPVSEEKDGLRSVDRARRGRVVVPILGITGRRQVGPPRPRDTEALQVQVRRLVVTRLPREVLGGLGLGLSVRPLLPVRRPVDDTPSHAARRVGRPGRPVVGRGRPAPRGVPSVSPIRPGPEEE